MVEKKFLISFLCLNIFSSFFVSTVKAEVAPTCSISFTPQMVKTGEPVTRTIQASGPFTSFFMRQPIVASGGSSIPSNDWQEWSGPSSTEAINFSVTTETFGIGKELYEGMVTGSNGSNTCSGSYTLIANNDWDWNKTTVLKNQITFTPTSIGVYACPTPTCYIRNVSKGDYPLVITKKNGDWYYVAFGGWVSSNQIPLDIIQKLENQNYSAPTTTPKNNDTDGDIDKNTTGTQVNTSGVSSTSSDGISIIANKSIVFLVLVIVVIVLFLVLVIYRVFRFPKLRQIIMGKNKLLLLAVILVASIIFGGIYFANQVSKQKFIERQQQVEAEQIKQEQLAIELKGQEAKAEAERQQQIELEKKKQQQATLDERQTQLAIEQRKQQQVAIDEQERELALSTCFEDAYKNTNIYWNSLCEISGVDKKTAGCLLPSDTATIVTAYRQELKDDCFKRYPQK